MSKPLCLAVKVLILFFAIAGYFIPVMMAQVPLRDNVPLLASGPKQLTPQQLQAAQSLSIAQIQQFQIDIQPALNEAAR